MEIIVGIGGVGCNIASMFEQYGQYRVLKIDHTRSDVVLDLDLGLKSQPEEYEGDLPDMKKLLSGLSGRALFVVSGASLVSGSILRIMEQFHLKGIKISALYVKPETKILSKVKVLQERVVFNVLQQYTRSGLLEMMYLIRNEDLDPLIEDASILNYHNNINKLIVSNFHMINVYSHITPVASTFSKPHETLRICTFGILNVETGEEKMFFPLDEPREKRYYYAIVEKRLTTEKELHRKIMNQVKEKVEEDLGVSYGIYSTDYEYDFGYVLSFSQKVQESS